MGVASIWIQLLRALIPSWRFFNDTMTVPILEGRDLKTDGSTGEWRPLIPQRGKRALYELFHNPRDTVLFASHAALEQFAADPASLTSRRLIESMARNYLASEASEFRIVLGDEEIFRSHSPEPAT